MDVAVTVSANAVVLIIAPTYNCALNLETGLIVVPIVVVNVPDPNAVNTLKVNVVPVGILVITQVPFSLTCSVPVAPEITIGSPIT